MSDKISAFVITSDAKNLDILRAVLKRARLASDELILINKGRILDVEHIAKEFEARYVKLPWSPTVEETRIEAVKHCSYNWIIQLDDDEILSPSCADIFREETKKRLQKNVMLVPIKHYILGRFDPDAYYWPEWRPSFYKRGMVEYSSAVHAGVHVITENVERLGLNSKAFITHLSHPNVSTFLEKANRYTDQPLRSSETRMLPVNYTEAAGTLRNLYAMIDSLKLWEAENLPDGNAEFDKIAKKVLAS